jgi:hypothetical protein
VSCKKRFRRGRCIAEAALDIFRFAVYNINMGYIPYY